MPNWLAFVHVLNTKVSESDYMTAEQSAINMFNHIAEVSKTVKSVLV